MELEEYTGNPDMSGSAYSGETRGVSEEVGSLFVCMIAHCNNKLTICVPRKAYC